MTTDQSFDIDAALAEGGQELLNGLKQLVYADAPDQASLAALERIELRLRDDGLVHHSAAEIEAMPTDRWLQYPPQDRARMLREVSEQQRAEREAAPRETDQQRREREFDAAMAEHHAEVTARLAASQARKEANREVIARIMGTGEDDARAARSAMRAANSKIARGER